jgi:hypothetical protein
VLEPALLLRDGRKLLYRPGEPSRFLDRLKEADIVFGGDSATLRRPAFEETVPDIGVDFEYTDRDGRRAAIELKLSSRDATPTQVAKWLSPFQRHAEHIDLQLELWVLKPDGAVLSIWSSHEAKPQNFGLYEVVWSSDSPPVEEAGIARVNSSYIERRAQRWVQEVDHLFSEVTHWAEGIGLTTTRLPYEPMHEELMHRFGVRPLPLTILTISRGKAVIATLVPVALWVVGARGRIDLVTAKESFILVNAAAFPKEARWQVLHDTASQQDLPSAFNRQFLEKILEKNEAA